MHSFTPATLVHTLAVRPFMKMQGAAIRAIDGMWGACAGMRKNCLMVLSHLILNDMMKVKGHIARLALCLQDDDPRIAGLAQVFFHELSRKASKVPQALHPPCSADSSAFLPSPCTHRNHPCLWVVSALERRPLPVGIALGRMHCRFDVSCC